MINDIRMHVAVDEAEQQALEAKCSASIDKNYQRNIAAFKQHVPNMVQQLSEVVPSSFALFVNKHAHLNIVNYATGETFYGFEPGTEIADQVNSAFQYLRYFDCDSREVTTPNIENASVFETFNTHANQAKQALASNDADALVILGVGLGKHILPLILKTKAKHVILYETDVAVLRASILSEDWHAILSYAAENEISIYFQLGDKAKDIFSDLAELKQHVTCRHVFVFKHLHTHLHNQIFTLIQENTWEQLKNNVSLNPLPPSIMDAVPAWHTRFSAQQWNSASEEHSLFQQNLIALEKTYPDLYQRFKDYQPSNWEIICSDNSVNALNKTSLVPFYGDHSQQHSEGMYHRFNKKPNCDGLIIGYRGNKARHFLHNRFLIKTESVMNQLENRQVKHPQQSKALIMFGLAMGYGLAKLVEEKSIEQLFVFEPNPDFFYASLYAIDWQAIFDKIEADESYLYLNIGDDGSHFSSDLMSHFYRIGPYVLNETYLYKAYENPALNAAVEKLREQLKLMMSMSENFDHSVAGINHSLESIKRNTPFLANRSPAILKQKKLHELPIFIVGNGPSLDYSIEVIKEHADQVIIVSCGTALQSLYKQNITPDFHAEIEQYRSTHDWATLLGDKDFLKQITLISCNGIHPDTCDLYKDVKLAFKQGEASSRAIHDLIGNVAFGSLETAYPTVSNFALSFFLQAGFEYIYLFGTDLGFVDINHHHSKTSAYYDAQGKPTYDYSESLNLGIPVAGNFRHAVSTKTEFDIARMSMEQALELFPKVNAYNTSDGAFIRGASPLNIDSVLILSDEQDKQSTLACLEDCFVTIDTEKFLPLFAKKYNKERLLITVDEFKDLFKAQLTSKDGIRELVDDVRQFLIDQYQAGNEAKSSLFFFYFHSMTNGLNALLTKTLLQEDEMIATDTANSVLKCYVEILDDCRQLCARDEQIFDTSCSFIWRREEMLLASLLLNKAHLSFNVVAEETDIVKAVARLNTEQPQYKVTCSHTLKTNQINIVFADTQSIVNKTIDQHLRHETDQIQTLIILFGAYDSWQQKVFKNEHIDNLSIMLVPPEHSHFSQAQIFKGEVPFFTIEWLLKESIKRSLDIKSFKRFVYKPVFCKSGLKSAYMEKRDEFSTDACRFIDTNLLPLLATDHFVNFNTYTAQLIDKYENSSNIATYQDNLGSRGQYFERQYRVYDLLGPWYLQGTIEAEYSKNTQRACSKP